MYQDQPELLDLACRGHGDPVTPTILGRLHGIRAVGTASLKVLVSPLYPVRLAVLSIAVAVFQRRHLGLGSRWKPLLIDQQLLHSSHEGCGAGAGLQNPFPAYGHGADAQPMVGHCSSIRP
jgi:hypothetical protein